MAGLAKNRTGSISGKNDKMQGGEFATTNSGGKMVVEKKISILIQPEDVTAKKLFYMQM